MCGRYVSYHSLHPLAGCSLHGSTNHGANRFAYHFHGQAVFSTIHSNSHSSQARRPNPALVSDSLKFFWPRFDVVRTSLILKCYSITHHSWFDTVRGSELRKSVQATSTDGAASQPTLHRDRSGLRTYKPVRPGLPVSGLHSIR
jgi:hypothetical protein